MPSREEEEMLRFVRRLALKLPRFPDKRIDYTNSRIAPIVTVFVMHNNNILLLKKSKKVSNYPGMWDVVAGFIDEFRPAGFVALEELKEETGISKKAIGKITIGKIYKLKDKEIKKTWVTCPVLVELKRDTKVKLNWEHTEYKWVDVKKIPKLNVLFDLEIGMKKLGIWP